MLGLTFFSASMWTGGALVPVLIFMISSSQFLSVIFFLVSTPHFLVLLVLKQETTHLLARYSFGIKAHGSPLSYWAAHKLAGLVSVLRCLPFLLVETTGWDINWLIGISGVLMTVTVFLVFLLLQFCQSLLFLPLRYSVVTRLPCLSLIWWNECIAGCRTQNPSILTLL